MNFEKIPNFSKKEKRDSEKEWEKIKEENIKKLREGKPEELKKRLELFKKQITEPVEKKIKDEKLEGKKACIHCGSEDHRSYNCPKLKDSEYLNQFMGKLKEKYK